MGSLPQDTSLVVRLSGVEQLLQKIEKSPLAKLVEDPEIQEVLKGIQSELDNGMDEAQRELGFDPRELLGSFRGEILVVFGGLGDIAGKLGSALSMGQDPEIRPESLPFAVCGDAGSSSAKVREYLGKLFAFAEKEGARKEIVTLTNGAKLTILRDEDAAADAAPGESAPGASSDSSDALQFVIGESGTRFFVGTSRKYLESLVGGGEQSTLSANPLFSQARGKVGDGDVFLYVDVKQMTGAVNNALAATLFSFYWQKVDRLLFGKSFNNLVATYTIEDQGMRGRTFLHNSGADDGILGILRGKSYAPTIPAFVPKGVHAYTSSSFNAPQLSKIVKDVFQMAMAFSQPGADIDSLMEMQLGVKFSALMNSFGQRIHYFGQPPSEDNPIAGMNYVIELADEAPAKKLLARLVENPAMGLTTETVAGQELVVIPTGMWGDMGLTVAGGKLILSGQKETVRVVIERMGASSPESNVPEDFQKVAGSLLPAEVCMLSYNSKDYMASSIESMAGTLGMALGPDQQVILKVLKLIGESFGTGVGYAQWVENGLYGDSVLQYR